MESNQNTLNLIQGMDVFGSDGEKVGSVQDVQGEYVVVSKGFFFPTDYYIPFSALGNADDESVYLNVTKDEALNQGWDQEPVAATTSTVYDDEPITDAGLHVDNPVAGSIDADDRPFDHRADHVAHDDVETDETIHVPLTEEELTAERRTVDKGAVRVEKDVIEEDVSLDVPVTREEVHVSRQAVDRDVRDGDATFEGGTIEVPVHGEEVDVQKQARVREELEISKDAVQDTERVTGTVRREEARVVDDADNLDRGERTRS
ncbi:MAG: DUF2382 domain-containing protein [Chloroflexota bacterium]|nr:DUF2382 domain-containing protein [Chloroflexota bacterium]